MWMPSSQPPHSKNAAVTCVTAAGRGGENLRNLGILRLTQMWSHIHDMSGKFWAMDAHQVADAWPPWEFCGTLCRYLWLRSGCLSVECSAPGYFNCWEMSWIITVRGIFLTWSVIGVLFRGMDGCIAPPTTRQPSLACGCLFWSVSMVDFLGQTPPFCSTRCSTGKLNSSLIITV